MYALLRKDAECRWTDSIDVCSGTSCGDDVTRGSKGVAACLSLVTEDKSCGDKWIEVGDYKCYCYPPDQVDCEVVTESKEDLYEIGKLLAYKNRYFDDINTDSTWY